MKKYTVDFETTTDPEDCRVWAYGICEIGNPDNFIYGNNIEDFLKFFKEEPNCTAFFHNLKFDSEFIISYLLNTGYEHIKDKKERKDKTFTTLISSNGLYYSLEIFYEVKGKYTNKVTFWDSLKIINFSVDKIAKDFKLDYQKLELDYTAKREVGHILTENEVEYLKHDVVIMALALDSFFKQDLTKMTIGSNALAMFKKTISSFTQYFPILKFEVDQCCRKSYRGGWTYLSPKYKGKDVYNGMVIDKNSMYPSQMVYEYLPYGQPIYFSGKYQTNPLYPLYIQTLSCSFKLKPNKLPTIQMKNTPGYMANEYLESSNGDILTLTLTSVDVSLFFEHYDVDDLTYHDGYMFKQIRGLFNTYIEKYTEQKINSKKEGNHAMYISAKLLLNSLYGKLGLNPRVRSKTPYLDDNGVVQYKIEDEEIRESIYVPCASFITALSRADIIRTSQKIRDYTMEKYGEDYYIYSDTDSIHCKELSEEELSKIVELDPYKLGAYDVETKFKHGRFIRQKCYIEQTYDDKIKTTIAGLPRAMGSLVDFDNFKIGMNIKSTEEMEVKKLRPQRVKGGVVLVPVDYTLK